MGGSIDAGNPKAPEGLEQQIKSHDARENNGDCNSTEYPHQNQPDNCILPYASPMSANPAWRGFVEIGRTT